ncbi:CoA transferase [Cyanobium sp. Morenito 9A2]|uniref:CoA transferase n=1 Tax=Cyanobium sp. Morenito 9A2 TaxID=2823718 RepID=UPI0020CE3A21|nr:CoA transferase [Cyanobium sp. Morenito 9A2]MCP9850915.1 CoA transferase [Cyanobium sp. Morenito 9A2]
MANVDVASTQKALDMIQLALGRREDHYGAPVTIKGQDPILASRHRFGELMAAAQASLGMALGDIWVARGGQPQSVTTDVEHAVHQHHGIAFLRQNGHQIGFTDYGSPVSFDDAVGGEFYPTRDGHFIKFELLYPRLRDAVYRTLRCGPTQRAVEAAVMQWNAEDLERAIREEGGAVGVVRSPDVWRAHPVGARLAAKPVVELTKIGESDPIPLPAGLPSNGRPLAGIKVLDSTHVIGGPITARTLAEFGADVLHLSRVDYPDHMNWRMETDIGKRAAYCDFRNTDDHQQFARLLQDADVFTCSYLNLDQKGISPRTLAESRPGIIAHELRCFDFEGEWANFRGFDMLAVAVSGYVDVEGAVDAPMMPVQAIFADYLAGYVGAAAVASALLRRADEGGSYQVRVSLTRMAMWAQEVGLLDAAALEGSKAWADLVCQSDLPLASIDSPFGEITYLPSLIEMPDLRPGFERGPQPLGSSPLSWG